MYVGSRSQQGSIVNFIFNPCCLTECRGFWLHSSQSDVICILSIKQYLRSKLFSYDSLAIILMGSVSYSGCIEGLDMYSCFTICHNMVAACFSTLVKFGAHSLHSIISWPPSGLISQDQDDSQIYEVILTIVYVKQIISCDEWVALAMKLHQP